MKTVTGRQIFEAIKQNGWEWTIEEYILPLGDGKYAACAIGQACLNLKIDVEHTLVMEQSTLGNAHPFFKYNQEITIYNDEPVSRIYDDDEDDYEIVYHTPKEITDYCEEVLTPVFDTEFTFEDLELNG